MRSVENVIFSYVKYMMSLWAKYKSFVSYMFKYNIEWNHKYNENPWLKDMLMVFQTCEKLQPS